MVWPSAGVRPAAVNACEPTQSQVVTYVSGGPDARASALLAAAPPGTTTAATSIAEIITGSVS